MIDHDATELGPTMAGPVDGDPSPALWLRRGLAYGTTHAHRIALAELDMAVAGDLSEEDLATAHCRRAVLLCRLGEYALARLAATESLAIRLSAAAYTARAMPRCLAGDLDGAWADTERALLLDMTYLSAHAVRGRVFLALGRPADALADFDVSTFAESYDGDARVDRAECLLILGEAALAVAACDEVIATGPDGFFGLGGPALTGDPHRVHLLRARADLALGDAHAALGDCFRAAALSPDAPEVYEVRAEVYQAVDAMGHASADRARAAQLRVA
ncbi:tetratricopeptide repeat protein [Herbidospora sp. RD11066]